MLDIVVTGGAGYIGSHVCDYLHANGYQVHVVDNLSQGREEFVSNYQFYCVDILDQARLLEIFQSIKPFAVVHLAGKTQVSESVKEPELYEQVNVQGTKNILHAMKLVGCKRLIFSSSCAVFGKVNAPITETMPKLPINPYGETKLKAEHTIEQHASKDSSFGYVTFRYFNAAGAHPTKNIGEVHEPETHLIPLVISSALMDKPVKIFGDQYETADGTCIRDYIHVCDIANAHLLALQKLKDNPITEDFHLGSGKGYSVLEVIETIEKVVGHKMKKMILPPREGDPPMLIADASKAKELLEFEPQYQLKAIVETAHQFHSKDLLLATK